MVNPVHPLENFEREPGGGVHIGGRHLKSLRFAPSSPPQDNRPHVSPRTSSFIAVHTLFRHFETVGAVGNPELRELAATRLVTVPRENLDALALLLQVRPPYIRGICHYAHQSEGTMMKHSSTTRRDFLKGMAVASAAAPYVWTSPAAAAEDAGKDLKIAAVGVGGSRGRYSRGGNIARQAAGLGRMVAVCDVDALHNDEFAAWCKDKKGVEVNKYQDYREMLDKEEIDVVTIGTPDHWHVPISIAAMKAGCDVYCEKPLTLTIDEGKQICRVVEETGKVFQVGSQQRTEYGGRFLEAIAIAQSGRLGGNLRAHVAIGGAPAGGPFENTDPPEGLDWDMWLGPAPKVPYCEERRKIFRWFLEYSGGKMTDWGAHHIDIAQWALGMDHTGPTEVSGTGKFPDQIPDYDPVKFLNGEIELPNAFNAPTQFDIDLKFANGSTLNVNHHYKSEDGSADFGNGILLVGDEGRIFVNRGRLSGAPVEEMTEAERKEIQEKVIELYGGKPNGHMRNFFECVESRELPVSDVFTHHRTMTSCHMCNITLLLGRPLKWNPEKQRFVGDDQANALMTRKQREPYVTKL